MKICWLENANFRGGAELFSSEMLQRIPDSVEVDVFLGTENEEIKNIFQKNTKILTMPSLQPFSIKNLIRFLKSVWKLKTLVLREKYEVIYANTVRTALIARIAKWFIPRSCRLIYFAHDYTFPSKFAHFFLSGFHKIGACSHGVKHFLMQRGIHSSRIEIIPNGVNGDDFSHFAPIAHPARKIACIGRITPWKGQLTVLHAAYLLKETHPELPFRFSFFGEPSQKKEDQEYYEHLLHFTKKHNLEGCVQFLGFTPSKKALEDVDIVVHAAEKAEPFGRVPLEAAAAKKILCLSNIGTPSQIFEHRKTALFFEPANAKSLAETLMEAYHNAPLGEAMIEKANILVREEFALSKVQEKFWNLFLLR